MKTYTVTFTENDLRTNGELLKRTQLTGKEVPAFNALMSALMAAKEVAEIEPAKPEVAPIAK